MIVSQDIAPVKTTVEALKAYVENGGALFLCGTRPMKAFGKQQAAASMVKVILGVVAP